MVGKRCLAAFTLVGGTVALLASLVPPAHAYTQRGVGVVTALRGEAAVAHAADVAARERRPGQEPLKFRDDVFFRDTIDTQRESTAKLLLRGRATFTIRELSRVELREGVVPADPTRTRSIVSLLAGAFRAIVQRDLRPQDELEVQTSNAIAAIRGTDIVVEVYRGAAPPLPPSAQLQPRLQPASFQQAQGVADIMTRIYVLVGLMEMEGLTAGPFQGIQKVGTNPPQLFRFLPDFVGTLLSPFGIPGVHGPLGADLARLVASNQSRAGQDAARTRRQPQFGGGTPLIESAVNSLTAALNQTVTINEQVAGLGFFGLDRFRLPRSSSFSLDPRFSPGLVTFGSAEGSISGFFSPPESFGFHGTLKGTVRLLSSGPGTVTFLVICDIPPPVFQVTLTGNFTLIGNKLFGTGSGQLVCLSGCTGTGATVRFNGK